jgi:hypothetical protein
VTEPPDACIVSGVRPTSYADVVAPRPNPQPGLASILAPGTDTKGHTISTATNGAPPRSTGLRVSAINTLIAPTREQPVNNAEVIAAHRRRICACCDVRWTVQRALDLERDSSRNG